MPSSLFHEKCQRPKETISFLMKQIVKFIDTKILFAFNYTHEKKVNVRTKFSIIVYLCVLTLTYILSNVSKISLDLLVSHITIPYLLRFLNSFSCS